MRPYRIWNISEQKYLRSRNYKYKDNAHFSALKILRYSRLGTEFAIVEIGTKRVLGRYTRSSQAIQFRR